MDVRLDVKGLLLKSSFCENTQLAGIQRVILGCSRAAEETAINTPRSSGVPLLAKRADHLPQFENSSHHIQIPSTRGGILTSRRAGFLSKRQSPNPLHRRELNCKGCQARVMFTTQDARGGRLSSRNSLPIRRGHPDNNSQTFCPRIRASKLPNRVLSRRRRRDYSRG